MPVILFGFSKEYFSFRAILSAFPLDAIKSFLEEALGIEFPELLIKFNEKNDISNEIGLFEKIFDDHFNSKYNSNIYIALFYFKKSYIVIIS